MNTQNIHIPYNKPYCHGKELLYIGQAVKSGKLSGNGFYTQQCQNYFEEKWGFGKCFLTHSCTDALEMCALLLNIQAGDEIILPSFTFVSCANAFALRGAKLVFADSQNTHPNIDVASLEQLISPRTKAILVMHYAGVSCDMNSIQALAKKYSIPLIEDAAQAIGAYHQKKALGTFGDLATFSFHETKNIHSGEGGMLVVNDAQYTNRAEILWEKGTNRSAFFRKEVDKYNWVDLGSSFLPSEITAAYLLAQLEELDAILLKRKQQWKTYHEAFQNIQDKVIIPDVPKYANHNAHIYYLICKDKNERNALIAFLAKQGINAVFHYQSLHTSEYYLSQNNPLIPLIHSENFSNTLIRLPLYFEMNHYDQEKVVQSVLNFFAQ